MPSKRSPGFDRLCATSNAVAQKVEVLVDGQVVTSTLGRYVAAGTVTQDRSGFFRQALDMTLTDASLIPLKADSYLDAAGEELRVWRGLIRPNRSTELMCLGTFGVQSVEWNTPFDGLRVTGSSRGQRVMDDEFEGPRYMFAGSAIGRLQILLTESVPFSSLSWDPAVQDVDLPEATYTPTSPGRAGACADIAAALGCEVFETPLGGFHLQPIPDPSGPANVALSDGQHGVIATAKRSVSRDNVYNIIICLGQTVDGYTPSGRAEDNDPFSRTYVPRFGRKVGRHEDSHYVTDGQCETSARAFLLDAKGAARTVSITGATNPALLVSDVAALTVQGRTEQHVFDRIVTPIGPGVQQIDTRTAKAQGVS